MAHAYQGPRFDVVETGRMYPFDFEAEERAARGVHDHILQVISREALRCVSCVFLLFVSLRRCSAQLKPHVSVIEGG